MEASWARCKANHAVNPLPKWFVSFDYILDEKGVWPEHVTCLHCVMGDF